jgi:hypothetical protein
MTLLSNALTTVDAVKEYLKIPLDNTGDDSRIEGLINACSASIENYCQRSFKKQQYVDEEYDGNNYKYINLLNYPVVSVDSVTLNDTLLTTDQYTVKKKPGILVRKYTGIDVDYYYRWHNAFWPQGDGNILVTYTAGYDVIPADLEQSCILYVMSFYKSDLANFSTQFADGFVFKQDAIPVQVKLMLQPYVRVDNIG